MLVGLAIVFAGCGGSKSSSQSSTANGSTQAGQPAAPTKTVHFAKTKFVLHAGLAFGAFHRYIYKPFKRGDFAHPLQHKAALVKGGLAAAFAYHEVKKALDAAQGSKLLSKLVAPLTALRTKLTTLASNLKQGKFSASDINSANTDVSSIVSDSQGAGAKVKDLPTPSLGG